MGDIQLQMTAPSSFQQISLLGDIKSATLLTKKPGFNQNTLSARSWLTKDCKSSEPSQGILSTRSLPIEKPKTLSNFP